MNLAFFGKLGWKLVKEKDHFWFRVMRTKYAAGGVDLGKFLLKKGSSIVLKRISRELLLINFGFKTLVCNG